MEGDVEYPNSQPFGTKKFLIRTIADSPRKQTVQQLQKAVMGNAEASGRIAPRLVSLRLHSQYKNIVKVRKEQPPQLIDNNNEACPTLFRRRGFIHSFIPLLLEQNKRLKTTSCPTNRLNGDASSQFEEEITATAGQQKSSSPSRAIYPTGIDNLLLTT